MGLNAKNAAGGGGGATAPVLEPGAYPARVCIVASLGVQKQQPFQGQEKEPMDELFVTYELSDEFMTDEGGNDIKDKPRWQSETFPFYNLGAEKAKSTKRYVALDPDITYDGDWTKLIGTPCLLTLSKTKSKTNGKEYNNVSNLSAMRKKEVDKLPELVNKPVVFDFDNPDLESFNALPEWVRNNIKEALNFGGSRLADLLGGSDSKPQNEKQSDDPEADSW